MLDIEKRKSYSQALADLTADQVPAKKIAEILFERIKSPFVIAPILMGGCKVEYMIQTIIEHLINSSTQYN